MSAVPEEPREEGFGVVERALDRAAGSRPIPGNRVELLFDGPEIFPAMLERIATAARWIHLDSYIFRADTTGRQFREALVERARAGVAVRVLTDWFGSATTWKRFWRPLRDAGGVVRVFNPPQIIQIRRNIVRDHRKVLVADGTTAVIGGHCIGNEWAGDPAKDREPWRETACAIDGPAAIAADRAFANLWAELGDELPSGELASEVPAFGDTGVRIVAGEPFTARASRVTELLLDSAEERVWITDAYLVAPRGIYQGLIDAARGGVDVRLLVPGTSDLSHLQNLTRIGYRDLLRAGVRVFEWRGPMLHAKTVAIDGRWVRVGSTNINLSSFLANYEIDVLTDDARLGQAMEAQFRRDLEGSAEILLRPPKGRLRRPLAAVPEHRPPNRAHHPGLRERRRRAVVAVWAVMAGARRTMLLQWSIALAGLGILFLIFPRILAVAFGVLALWLAVSAWLESWGREGT